MLSVGACVSSIDLRYILRLSTEHQIESYFCMTFFLCVQLPLNYLYTFLALLLCQLSSMIKYEDNY